MCSREVLTPAGQSDLDNYGLMSAIFDHMEKLFPPASFLGIERANTQFSAFYISVLLSLSFCHCLILPCINTVQQ